jgi:hypothetical protein
MGWGNASCRVTAPGDEPPGGEPPVKRGVPSASSAAPQAGQEWEPKAEVLDGRAERSFLLT